MKLGVIMDPIEHIKPENDTTVHLLDAAQRHGFSITYLPQKSLYILNGEVWGLGRTITVQKNKTSWFQETHIKEKTALTDFDVILMRKDPPFNLDYIYTTYMLELVEKKGVLIVNKPQSLRDANEKLFATHFPYCCPPTLISSHASLLMDFWKQEKNVVFKPLDKMAGQSIFVAHENDPNVHVIIETLTENGTTPILVQRYLPEIHTHGDKRILIIDGKPAPFAVARFPAHGETRANLAVGGKGVVIPLTDHDKWLCEQVGPTLKEKNLLFVGIDVIGNFITEINVTSPTGLAIIAREQPSVDIAGDFIQSLIPLLKK
jgi:glutathione synthase